MTIHHPIAFDGKPDEKMRGHRSRAPLGSDHVHKDSVQGVSPPAQGGAQARFVTRTGLKIVQMGLSAAIFLGSLAVLVFGWGAGAEAVAAMTRLPAGSSPMPASSAILIAFVSLIVFARALRGEQAGLPVRTRGVWARGIGTGAVWTRGIGTRGAGILVIASMVLHCALLLAGYPSGLDAVLPGAPSPMVAEGMSLATSINFLLIGVALSAIGAEHANRARFVWASTLGLGLSFFELCIFAFDARALHALSLFSPASLPSALALFVLFALLIGFRPEWSWLAAVRAVQTSTRADPVHPADDLARIEALDRSEPDPRAARESGDVAARTQSSVLTNMSHELRTPMNGMLGFTQLLLATELDAEQRKYTELILESGESMTALLNDILDLAKIEGGKMELHPQPTIVRDLVISVTSAMKVAASRKGLHLFHSIESDVPHELMLDGVRVKQILSNLLSNAVKFTDKGSIELHILKSETSQVVLEFIVSDTGIGIAPDKQSVVFDSFSQADDTLSRSYGGTGLGLPISQALAHLMGGSLRLESEQGKGTTITLVIPCILAPQAAEQEACASQDARQRDRLAGTKRRILVAEDSDANQALMSQMLAALGFNAERAGDGYEVMDMVRKAKTEDRPFDVLLIDVNMPGMGGLEVTRRLRARGFDGRQLPIIALTGSGFDQDVEACFNVGMQEHLTKPIGQQDLIDALDRWIDKSA